MKRKFLLYLTICACFMVCLLVFPSNASEGVRQGLQICASVIIPSLFPFTVVALILFSIDFSFIRTDLAERICKILFGIDFKGFILFCLSNLGGYPVGAKLIDTAYKNGELTRKNAELMLGYCVNSGPAFIVLAVGAGIWGNKTLGYLLLSSSILASLLIALTCGRFTDATPTKIATATNTETFGERFVNATYDATQSILKICSSVVIFSAIINLLKPFIENLYLNGLILSLLEITNGVIISGNNIYLTAFLLGFGGISVHFQVFSICNTVKPNYLRFLFFRILHGILTATILSVLLKIFKISLQTAAVNSNFCFELTKYSIIFSVMLLICGILFMVSVNKSDNFI